MRFEGEFRVPGRPDEVLDRFADIERMVRCMPGARIEGRTDDGEYLGTMVVAFGPKKIKFRGKVAQEVDRATQTGRLQVRGSAEIRTAARVELRIVYSVCDDPAAATPTTVVALSSDAEMGGVLAEFARTGGVTATRVLMESFAARLAEEFGDAQRALTTAEKEPTPLADAPRPAETDVQATARSESTVSPAPLSAGRLIWEVVMMRLRILCARLRFLLRRS